MPTIPSYLDAAFAIHKHERMLAAGVQASDAKTARARRAILNAHADNIHRWNCLRHAIHSDMQPVSAGWAALSLGYVPGDWALPDTFPGSARA